MAVQSIYGVCKRCDFAFSPVYFLEEERDKHHCLTGRVRRAVNCLICDCCGHKECVDDSLDGPWFTPSEHTRR